MDPIRVLLVDNNELLIDALALRLAAVPDLLILGSYATQDGSLLRDIARQRPDVTTVEVQQAGADAARLLAAMRRAWPAGKILVLTGSRDTELAVAVAHAGAAGWLAKDSSLGQLHAAIHAVHHGCGWYPPMQLGAILRSINDDSTSSAITSVSPLF